MCFSLNIVCTLTFDRENGKRRHGRHWLRHWGTYSSLDHSGSSSELLGHLPIFYLDSSPGSRRRYWKIVFNGQAITIC